jgi:hypothetical protein
MLDVRLEELADPAGQIGFFEVSRWSVAGMASELTTDFI